MRSPWLSLAAALALLWPAATTQAAAPALAVSALATSIEAVGKQAPAGVDGASLLSLAKKPKPGTAAKGEAPAPASATMRICRMYRPALYSKPVGDVTPNSLNEVKIIQGLGLAAWYTDMVDASVLPDIRRQLATCPGDSRIPVVIHGMPNKNCDGTTAGTLTSINEYHDDFLTPLAAAFPDQHMLYVLEPGALSLLAVGGCGRAYSMPLKVAAAKLSENANAQVYLDLNYRTVNDDTLRAAAVAAFKDIASFQGVRLAGVALNTGDYQTNAAMTAVCNQFLNAVGGEDVYKCVIDTSRNFQGPTPSGQTCNAVKGGLGIVPSFKTEHRRIAYYLWLKTPGESDGLCEGKPDARQGPPVGEFYQQYMSWLWGGGYLKEHKYDDEQKALDHVKVLNGEMQPPTPKPEPKATPAPTPKPEPKETPPAPAPAPKEEEDEPPPRYNRRDDPIMM